MMKPIFDENGHASQAGVIRCYYYNPTTGVHTGWSDEYIPEGVSIPGDCTIIEPPEWIEGVAQVWDGDKWNATEDHRGVTVYSTENSAPVTVDYIGRIHEGFTPIAPTSTFDKWDGKKWVLDENAKHRADVAQVESTKAQNLTLATKEIAPLQDAIDLDMATNEEITLLKEWKKYRVLLNRVDASLAPDVDWPKKP